MIEQGLVALLTADSTLSGLIGNRLFPALVPEGSMPVNAGDPPCLSYQMISGPTEYTLEPKQQDVRRIQFDAWGVAYADCKNIVQALRNVLSGYSGTLTDGTRVQTAVRINEFDNFADKPRVYRVTAEYSFRFVEP